MSLQKYLFDYLRYKLSNFVAGRKNYEDWKIKNYSLKTVEIKNKELAKELERACQKKGGFLTYSEFIHIDQFGQNGYHKNYKDHGITDAHKRWSKALALLCKEKSYSHVFEFGPGKGDLAVKLVKASKKIGNNIIWSGVEINEELCNIIKARFKEEGLEKNLKEIARSLNDIAFDQKSIFIFSYSLDSVPPEIFINTKDLKSSPDALIGILVKDGILNEIALTEDLLKTKKISLKKGIYKDAEGYEFDVSTWKLYRGQRAYIPINALSILADLVNRATQDSLFVIIDEFRPPPLSWETGHFCLPKDLHTYTRDIVDLEEGYENTGRNLLYFPTYLSTFLKFLQGIGFRSIQYDIEEKMAKDLSYEKWQKSEVFYATYAFIASGKTPRSIKKFRITFPQARPVSS